MKRAWDSGDADAYAECFTADASYVSFVGAVYRGRADIAECHRALFARFARDSVMQMTRTEISLHGAGWQCAAFQNTQVRPLMRRVSESIDKRFRPMRER